MIRVATAPQIAVRGGTSTSISASTRGERHKPHPPCGGMGAIERRQQRAKYQAGGRVGWEGVGRPVGGMGGIDEGTHRAMESTTWEILCA